ncbi:MAG TPA: hypothetical protein ENI87_06920 [bacterium]|nr:hypothetical protein [bacterium]
MQGSGKIRAPATAQVGGTITVEVGSGITSIEVSLGGPDVQSFPVPAGGKVTFPVPSGATGGMVVAVSVGKGLAKKTVLVEIVSTSP